MTVPPSPPPDLGSAARWRAVAFALAGVSAFLSGLLLLTFRVDATSSAAPDASTAAEKDASTEEAEVEKRGKIEGIVTLSGTPPAMQVPRRRKTDALCKYKLLPSNAVVVNDGRLKDVLVRIEHGGVKGDYVPPDQHVAIDHEDCMLTPRIQGAVLGQELELRNGDPSFHNVHVYLGAESWLKKPQPNGSVTIQKTLDAPGILKIVCDVHPWERSFLVVSDHPYFAVTDEVGRFAIPDVPAGRYMLEAFHPRYGLRRVSVEVGDKTATAAFAFDVTDREPEINKGEGEGQF